MAKFSLRRFEDQAKFSVWLSLGSVLPFLGIPAGILWKGQVAWGEWMFYYGPRLKAGILLCAVAALMLSAIGFGCGLNSAGQRRNERQRLSWIGFFVGALVLTLTVVMLAVYRWRGEPAVIIEH